MLIDNETEEIIVTKQQFNKKIGEFISPQFTIKYIKDLKLVECKALCDLRNLKVPKPPKEPDMTVGNLTIQELSDIIEKIFDKNLMKKSNPLKNKWLLNKNVKNLKIK